MRAGIAICRQLRCTAVRQHWEQDDAAQWRMEDSWLVFSLLMAGDDGNDASPTVTGCVLFILSEIDVRLLTEEPRATAVNKTKTKQKEKTAQCSRNFCCPFSEMQFFLSFFFFFFLNIWVTCTQIKVAGFCGMKLYSPVLTVRTVLVKKKKSSS